MRQSLLALAVTLGYALSVQASVPIFYTQLGSPDVFSSSYDPTTNALGAALSIGFSVGGADGILIGPNSTLFYGGKRVTAYSK